MSVRLLIQFVKRQDYFLWRTCSLSGCRSTKGRFLSYIDSPFPFIYFFQFAIWWSKFPRRCYHKWIMFDIEYAVLWIVFRLDIHIEDKVIWRISLFYVKKYELKSTITLFYFYNTYKISILHIFYCAVCAYGNIISIIFWFAYINSIINLYY